MKGKNLIITALLVLAAGIILIITRASVRSEGVVTAGGILFIVAGLLDLLVFESDRRKDGKRPLAAAFNWITSAGAVILGLCMLIFKSTFVELIPFMFGILIAFAALYQVYLLAYGSRPVMLPGWLYIAPLLLAGAAVYLFMLKPMIDDHIIMLTSGIALALFGAVALIEGAMLGHYHRHPQAAAAKDADNSLNAAAAQPAPAPAPEPLDQHTGDTPA